jgi:hypothetical protein
MRRYSYLVKWPSLGAVLVIWAAAMEWTRLIFLPYVAAMILTVLAGYPLAHLVELRAVAVGLRWKLFAFGSFG